MKNCKTGKCNIKHAKRKIKVPNPFLKKISGLRNELRLSIDENEMLHKMLKSRPLEVKSPDFENVHPEYGNNKYDELLAIIEKQRINVKLVLNGESFWVMPIHGDGDGFFIGVVNNDLIQEGLKYNDLVDFTINDVLEIA